MSILFIGVIQIFLHLKMCFLVTGNLKMKAIDHFVEQYFEYL